MPKSRRRPKRDRANGRPASRSGNPQRRAAEKHIQSITDPAERAAARVAMLLAFGDAADPLQAASILPLFLDVVVAGNADVPAQRCLDDCTSLSYAYAQLGIPAQVRATELTITNPRTGDTSRHGALAPAWEDDMIHGHTIVWLPEQHCLVDPTADQFPLLMGQNLGPVIARDEAGDDGPIRRRHGKLQLAYDLAPAHVSAALLDHPRMKKEGADHRRRGLNIASAAIALMNECLPPDRAERIPHPRVAALVTATADLRDTRTPEGDWRFFVPGSPGKSTQLTLDQIPLPPGTPPATAML